MEAAQRWASRQWPPVLAGHVQGVWWCGHDAPLSRFRENGRVAAQHVQGRLAPTSQAEAVADEPLAPLVLGEEGPQVTQPRLLHRQHAQRRLVGPPLRGRNALQQVAGERQQHRGGQVEEVHQGAAAHRDSPSLNLLRQAVQGHGVTRTWTSPREAGAGVVTTPCPQAHASTSCTCTWRSKAASARSLQAPRRCAATPASQLSSASVEG